MDPDLITNPSGGLLTAKPNLALIDDGLLPDDFSSKFDYIKLELSADKRKWYARYLKEFVKLGAYVCRLDFRRNFRSAQRAGSREPLWTDLLSYFYWYFAIKTFVAIYHHCIFDYYKYELNRFDQMAEEQSQQNGAPLTPVQIQFRQTLIALYGQARSSYKAIGAPFMHLGNIATIGFFYFVIATFAIYMFPQQYHKLHKPFDYSMIYAMIAPHKLQKSIDSAICEVVNSFLVTSKAYNRLLIEQKTCETIFEKRYRHRLLQLASESIDGLGRSEYESDQYCKQQPYRELSMSETNSIRQALTNEISHNHQFFVRQIKIMALNGLFQPFNRRDKWLTKIGDIYGLTLICLFCYGLVCIVLFMAVCPYLFKFEMKLEKDPLDLLFYAEVCLIGIIASIASGSYLTLIIMVCLDQAHEVSYLIRLIDNCISTSTHRLRGYINRDDEDDRIAIDCLDYLTYDDDQTITRPVSSSPTRQARGTRCRSSTAIGGRRMTSLLNDSSMCLLDIEINLILMLTFIHYKLYIKHLRPTLDTLSLFATVFTFIMFVPVIVTRIFLAYMMGWQKMMALSVCVLILVTTTCACSLMCWLHSRCSSIYRHLQSLMAHTNAMNHAVKKKTGRAAYDNHLMWVLHRELSYPEKLFNQCAILMSGLQSRLTYAFLLKCVFWWSLLVISIIQIDTTRPEADAFGHVWKFYQHADEHLKEIFQSTRKA